jgi:glycerol-1-phosphate dehydrogenase [NAD(P)+]
MPFTVPSYVSDDAVASLCAYVAQQGMSRFVLVADDNTWRALGERVAAELTEAGHAVRTVLLRGEEIIADEEQLVQVLLGGGDPQAVYLAVGSGTITDIVRFVSHRCGRPFISLPTAPSVDAYASVNSPLVIQRLKRTVNAQAPLAVFGHLPTLCQAPRAMVAAGFGDVLGKYVCLADWQLGHLLWDEPYDQEIAHASREALKRVASQAEGIGQLRPAAIQVLLEGLIASGVSMVRMGDSSPASASEHHLSHFWEIKLLQERRPALLHGAKVGAAAVMMAREWERIRDLQPEQAMHLARTAQYPDADTQRREIHNTYGSLAEQVIAAHAAFVEMSTARRRELGERIASQWGQVQAIAATVPSAATLTGLLAAAGAATTPQALGLSDGEVALAREAGHYIRSRFTVRKLEIALGLN